MDGFISACLTEVAGAQALYNCLIEYKIQFVSLARLLFNKFNSTACQRFLE